MESGTVGLRVARPEDAPALLEIYAPYVRETAITFEYAVPDVAAFADRVRATLVRYPWIVAERGGRVLGYACAGVFHARAAYDWAVETSVYVARDARRQGLGQALYAGLEALLARQGVLNANACIAWAEPEDARLRNESPRFHERMGYRLVGRFRQCGYKFATWYDMVWMEKHLGAHTCPPAPFVPFGALDVPGRAPW